MLISVAYFSRPAQLLTDEDLIDLWETARENNEKRRVTGALYFDSHVFFQVLEGEDEMLMPLLHKIEKDPRHKDFRILVENDIASPSFRNWPMKYLDGRNSKRLQQKFAPDALGRKSITEVNAAIFFLVTL